MIVMPALVAGIHVLSVATAKTWMAGTSPATTIISACNREALSPPQIEPDLLADELQCVGLAVIEASLGHAGVHHLVEEVLHAGVRHGADAECRGVAGIDDAVLLHGADRIGQQVVAHLRVLF